MLSKRLSLGQQLIFASGICGIWVLWQAVGLYLIMFYVPPKELGIPEYIPHAVFLGIFSIISLITVFSRLFDLVIDPWVANLSDHWSGKGGRRKPFMQIGCVGALLLGLLFFPLTAGASYLNAMWLLGVLFVFYFIYTLFAIPYWALMAELTESNKERINLGTWVGFSVSISLIIVLQVPVLAHLFAGAGHLVHGYQYALTLIGFIAFVMMLVPVLFLKMPTDASVPKVQENYGLWHDMQIVYKNVYMRPLIWVFLIYYASISIISAVVPYVIFVLIKLPLIVVSQVVPFMVLSSLIAYPVANFWAKRYDTKFVSVLGLSLMAICFIGFTFLGYYPISPMLQASLIYLFVGFPVGLVAVALPIHLTDVTKHAHLYHQQSVESMFFTLKNIAMKMGAFAGITLVAILLLLGKDRGDDLGIRICTLVGGMLCFMAMWILYRYFAGKQLSEELNQEDIMKKQ